MCILLQQSGSSVHSVLDCGLVGLNVGRIRSRIWLIVVVILGQLVAANRVQAGVSHESIEFDDGENVGQALNSRWAHDWLYSPSPWIA